MLIYVRYLSIYRIYIQATRYRRFYILSTKLLRMLFLFVNVRKHMFYVVSYTPSYCVCSSHHRSRLVAHIIHDFNIPHGIHIALWTHTFISERRLLPRLSLFRCCSFSNADFCYSHACVILPFAFLAPEFHLTYHKIASPKEYAFLLNVLRKWGVTNINIQTKPNMEQTTSK